MDATRKTTLKLLVVGYYFMRTRSAGGHRLFAMVKYLSRRGWDATVLTAARGFAKSGESDDSAASRYIPPETRVIPTGSVELDWMWTPPRRSKSDRNSGSKAGAASDREMRKRPRDSRLRGFVKVPARWVRTVLSFPDRGIGWFFPLLFHGWKLLRGNKFEVVLTSGPPHSCHLPFVVLKKCFGFTWVCDFRDPWTDPPMYAADHTSLSTNRISLFLNRLLERRVLRSCDRVLANTAGNGEALRRTFGELVQGKLMVLTNGFDEEVTPSRGSLDDTALDCDFVFTGHIYLWMMDVYLEALKYMCDADQQLPRLHVFGVAHGQVIAKVREYGLENHVLFMGSVSYEESLWLLNHAKALLLPFVARHEVFRHSVPSKMYAYLFSRRPYLALVPDGDAAQILDEVGGGTRIKSSEPREVAAGITSFLAAVNAGTIAFERDRETLKEYSWATLSARLDSVLRVDIDGRRTPSPPQTGAIGS